MPYKTIKKYIKTDKLKASLVKAAGVVLPASTSYDVLLEELFSDMVKNSTYDDSKDLVDLIPTHKLSLIGRKYESERSLPGFNIDEFINRYFYNLPSKNGLLNGTYIQPIDKYITNLWSELKVTNRRSRGSLQMLPNSYIIPGGRFKEQFYWDSYFIMLGLAADHQWDMIDSLMKNFAYMIRKWGFIPTANRSYFLSRSQPPFYAQMVNLVATKQNKSSVYITYLPYLIAEYKFWMRGKNLAAKSNNGSHRRVVNLAKDAYLNRYYDKYTTARPESFKEDNDMVGKLPDEAQPQAYLDLRAAAESGWDFSSRWFVDPYDISTIQTTKIVPIDLNCLLVILEQTIAKAYRIIRNYVAAQKYTKLAEKRIENIQTFCWDNKINFFVDYNFHTGQPSERITLAGIFALYAKVATEEQARKMVELIKTSFLKNGGLVTTLIDSGQQWDAPNGWAPLQWVAVQGLRNYGYSELADTIRQRWIESNKLVYEKHSKLFEKYNVENPQLWATGGEYTLQDGFGWTNGVLKAFLAEEHDV